MAKSVPYASHDNSLKFCTKCKNALLLENFYTTGKKVTGLPKYNSWCKACISKKQASYHKRTWGPERLQHSAFRRTKTARSYLAYLRNKALKRGKGGDVTLDAIELIWKTQGGKCALTGWEMTMELGQGSVATNCSIDRIDSMRGYEADNVQLVCRAANVAKSNLATSDFVALCRAVAEVYNA